MHDIEQIYKEYFETVNKYLYCLTHDFEISEELTQETFYRMVKNIHKFKGDCKISTWLCQIAKNLWYTELKKKNKNIVLDENALFFEIDKSDSPENIAIFNDSKKEFYKNFQKLDKKTKEVMYLRIEGDLSFKEIATILDKTENWARVTFYRGKQKLKEVGSYEK